MEDAFRLQQLGFDEVRVTWLLPLTGDPGRAQRKMRHITRSKEKSNTCAPRPSAPSSIRSISVSWTTGGDSGRRVRCRTGLMRSPPPRRCALKECGETQVYVSKPVIEVEAAGFEVLGGLLEAFVTTVNDLAARGPAASPKSRMLIHLIPESSPDRDATPTPTSTAACWPSPTSSPA